jgi:RNA polymerase sigma-70 factor, ECF subfamily
MTRRTSFEAQAVPHMAAALTLAFWLVRSRADAEDIVQNSYVRAYRAFDSFRGDNFKAWLLAIVRNQSLTWLSQRKRLSNVISFDEAFAAQGASEPGEARIASDAPSAEDALIGEGERALVMAALDQLPPLYREVLVLREVEDLSYQLIATITGVPIGTVMSRLARARARLRDIVLAQEKKEACR